MLQAYGRPTYLLGFWWLLSLVKDSIEALVEPAPDAGVFRRGVVLQETQ